VLDADPATAFGKGRFDALEFLYEGTVGPRVRTPPRAREPRE
jgi:hypothetical protein